MRRSREGEGGVSWGDGLSRPPCGTAESPELPPFCQRERQTSTSASTAVLPDDQHGQVRGCCPPSTSQAAWGEWGLLEPGVRG